MRISDIPDQMESLGYCPESCMISDDCLAFGDDFMIERDGETYPVADPKDNAEIGRTVPDGVGIAIAGEQVSVFLK